MRKKLLQGGVDLPGTALGCVRCGGSTECYWAYTTERTEKEALKIYLARYGTLQEAITRIEEDRKADGGLLYAEFARKVNQHQKVMSLW